MLVTAGIHLSAPFGKKEVATLRISVHSSILKRRGGEPKNRQNSVVANTSDLAQAGKEVTSLMFRSHGDFSARMSGIPAKSVLQQVDNKFAKKFRLSRRDTFFCSRAREGRPRFGEYSPRW